MENDVKLSFLILTHNRPKLFNRCLNSILQFSFPFNIEILINNDSNDIYEIYSDKISIRYFKNSDYNLGNLYKFLFDQASGEYIYFLEDDDYLSKNFLKYLENDLSLSEHDLFYMNYKKVNNRKNFLPFYMETKNIDFQLSQILFKKQLLSHFPVVLLNNQLDNDWKLFQILLKKSKLTKIVPNFMFIQTCDGKDNISFPQLNKDERWIN